VKIIRSGNRTVKAEKIKIAFRWRESYRCLSTYPAPN